MGGDSHCAGRLEVKQAGWKPADGSDWTLKEAVEVCKELDCGSAVSVKRRKASDRSVWWISSDFVQSGSFLRDCVILSSSSYILDLTCSGKYHCRVHGLTNTLKKTVSNSHNGAA